MLGAKIPDKHNRALALTTLIDCNRGIVDNLKEGHDTLRLTIGTLDVRTQCAHWRQSLPKPPAINNMALSWIAP